MARLTRDFSGRSAAPAGFLERKRPPAHAKKLLERRADGELVDLLRVAVDDWDGGWEFDKEARVERVVCVPDCAIASLDLSCAVALDCVVVGECPPDRFNQALLALFQHGAASVWGQFADGYWRVVPWAFHACGYMGVHGPLTAWVLPAAVRAHREACLLLGEGVYAADLFQPAREAVLASMGITPDYRLITPWPPAPDPMDAVRDAQADCGKAARDGDAEAYAAAQVREAAAWRVVDALEGAGA